MKCINKYFALFLVGILCFTLIGCKNTSNEEYATYDVFKTSYQYDITKNGSDSSVGFFAEDLVISAEEDIGVSNVDSQVAGAGAAFNLGQNTTVYAQNIHGKMYPASTTKILTCYTACLYGDLDSFITVSANAVNQEKDSSVCNLKEGDVITLRDLLFGLMLRSGNDAAIAIAEGVSQDVDSFVKLMNETALSAGATNSHFVNPNGLHNEDHYTTVYDMYLILNKALENDNFYQFFSATNYNANYTSQGQSKTQSWTTTNQYLTGNVTTPSDFSVIGGKTGTTGAAGYCLVLLSENRNHERIISIVYNADCRSNLYLLMNEILSQYCG